MQITAGTMVELKAKIYEHHGWKRKYGESMAARIKPLYDVRIDYNRSRFVATPKKTTK